MDDGKFSWQHPYVDLFKYCQIDRDCAVERKGDVEDKLDRTICKRVFAISGAVSANNYLLMPGTRSSVKSLGLSGEYVYLQLKAHGGKLFVVHLDFVIATTSFFRMSLSNMFAQERISYHCLQVPLVLGDHWTTVCLHIPSALAYCSRLPAHSFVLRSIQFCSALTVRNAFTSDRLYTKADAPRDMRLEPVEGDSVWVNVFMDAPVKDLDHAIAMRDAEDVPHESVVGSASKMLEMLAPYNGAHASLCDPFLEVTHVVGTSRKRGGAQVAGHLPGKLAVFVDGSMAEAAIIHGDGRLFKQGTASNNVLYAASTCLITTSLETGHHRCHLGHTEHVDLVEVSDSGEWVLSVQLAEDTFTPPLVRVWHVVGLGINIELVASLACPALTLIRAAAFEPLAAFVAIVGNDIQGRQQLRIWDVARVVSGGDTALVARQVSADWDIQCLKFSPFERMQLVTCGHENIRFWRIKEDGHIPGRNVVLNSLASQSMFTSIAFEFTRLGMPYLFQDNPVVDRRIFVGSSRGSIVQLSGRDQTVQAVFSLHDDSILDLCANEMCVVTAAADGLVRVWPLDFKSFFIHAKHDSAVAGVSFAFDGMQVLCCTVDGSVGILELQTHKYRNVAHAHGDYITGVSVSEVSEEIASISADGIVKIWSARSMTQTHEFYIANEVPQAVDFHPVGKHLIAVGFGSGALRLFDIDALELVQEVHRQDHAIVALSFVTSPSGITPSREVHIVTCDARGTLTVYAESCNFEIVQCLEQIAIDTPPVGCPPMACSSPYVLIYSDPQCVKLIRFPGLEPKCSLEVSQGVVSTFNLSRLGHLSAIGTADAKVHIFRNSDGSCLSCIIVGSAAIASVSLSECQATSHNHLVVVVVGTAENLISTTAVPAETRTDEPVTADQAFLAHASPPKTMMFLHNQLVSMSSSEIIRWHIHGELLTSSPMPFSCSAREDRSTSAAEGQAQATEPLPIATAGPSSQQQRHPQKAEIQLDHPRLAPSIGKSVVSLKSIFACSVRFARQAVAWHQRGCVLAHATKAGVQVSKLTGSDGSDDLLEMVQTTVLISPTCTHAIAVAWADHPELRLGVLSLEKLHGQIGMYLHLWSWQDHECLDSRLLPHAYYSGIADLQDCHGLALLCTIGAAYLVTATTCLSRGSGRVDVWRITDDKSIVLHQSAEMAQAPTQILSLAGTIEFATVCRHVIIIWQICDGDSHERHEGCPPEMRYQLAEEPSTWSETSEAASCVCLVQAEDSILMLVGTDAGKLWIHDAQQNIVIAYLPLTDCGPLVSVACCQWPFVMYGVTTEIIGLDVKASNDQVFKDVLSIRLDGDIVQIYPVSHLGRSAAYRGLATTTSNSLWYFDLESQVKVPLFTMQSARALVLRSNWSWRLAATDLESKPAMLESPIAPTHGTTSSTDETLIMGFEDGHVSLLRPDLAQTVVATFRADSACVAACFLNSCIFATAFASGLVIIGDIYSLQITMQVQTKLDGALAAMECCGSTALLLGSSAGELLQIVLTSAHEVGLETFTLERAGISAKTLAISPCSAAVCTMAVDHPREPRRVAVSLASMEVLVFDVIKQEPLSTRAGQVKQDIVCLLRSWVWPEASPAPHSIESRANFVAGVFEPPISARFVLPEVAGPSETTVLVFTPFASCIYLFSCASGEIVNRVPLPSFVSSVRGVWPFAATACTAGDQFAPHGIPKMPGHVVVLVLSATGWACLHLDQAGHQAKFTQSRSWGRSTASLLETSAGVACTSRIIDSSLVTPSLPALWLHSAACLSLWNWVIEPTCDIERSSQASPFLAA